MMVEGFRHEAMLYNGWPQFLAGTVGFIRDGLAAGEPVLVVESREKIDRLRDALGDDAERVMFADMADVGANPARIIPAWREFVDVHGADGKRLRGIGEPIWKGRTDDELVECQRHESLLNVAFAGGQPWYLLCPYDTGKLDPSVIDEARRSHEYVSDSGGPAISDEFRGVDACGEPFCIDLPMGDDRAESFGFDDDRLLRVRGAVARFATEAGLTAARATRLVTATNEVATNSIVHGGGNGTLRMWRAGDDVVCEVRDAGRYTQALADRERPGGDPASPRGLWLANQLCDLVQIRTLPEGTVVRLHMHVRE
jgi:anti-sigma regulatory factor (Ser/Thr protein kinase)